MFKSTLFKITILILIVLSGSRLYAQPAMQDVVYLKKWEHN